MNESIIKNAYSYVEKMFENDFSGHDCFHTYRVCRTAKIIAENEEANVIIVQLAALLHDVDDIKLSPGTYANKERAKAFLIENGVDESTIQNICEIISEVSFAGKDSIIPKTIEGKCVQDADRLDALGAIGIARAFAYGGNRGRIIYNPEIKPKIGMGRDEYNNSSSTTVNHFYEKLFWLKDMMNTDSGKKIAEERECYMKEYISRFMDEWKGIK